MSRQDQDPIDDVIDIRRRKLRLMLLGEIKELPNEYLHTPHTVVHRYPILLLPARRQRPLPQVVEAVEDPPQRIVDFMGYPRGKPSDRDKLLGILDLLLQFFGLRHVARDAQHA